MADETIPLADKMYPVMSFCKQELVDSLEDTDEDTEENRRKLYALTEVEMKWIALKLSEALCNCCYYDQVEYYAKEMIKNDKP
jgi:hypothetical protein